MFSKTVASSFSHARRMSASAPTTYSLAVQDRHIGAAGALPKTLLLFCHATGFCKGVWDPVLEDLDLLCKAAGVGVATRSLDFSGHGESWKRGELSNPKDWSSFTIRDIAEALDSTPVPSSVERICGIGHSMGAAGLVLASLAGVRRFSHLVLYEPIIFRKDLHQPECGTDPDAPLDVRNAAQSKNNPLSVMASRRGFLFPSKPHAKDYFLARALFQRWDPRALDGYIRDGLMATDVRFERNAPPELKAAAPEASRVTLCCDRRFESDVYLGAPGHDAWDNLTKLSPRTLVVAGQDTDTILDGGDPVAYFEHLATRMPHGKSLVMEGTGHFGPMEQPQTLARIIAASCEIVAPEIAVKSKL